MKKFLRYKQNLCYDNEYVYSYGIKVGKIRGKNLICYKWYSMTTSKHSKHVNYAARMLNLEPLRSYGKDKKEIAYFEALGLWSNRIITQKNYDSLRQMISSPLESNLNVARALIKEFKKGNLKKEQVNG